MRKLALLLAAALIVSVPLVASAPTDSYAAAKKARAGKGGKEAKIPPNTAYFYWLSDLGASLSNPNWGGEKGGKGGKKAKRR